MPAASTAAAADIIERVDGSCVHADRNTSLCPELLPMKPIFDSTGVQTTTNVNKPKSALHIPCNATKNNLIKLNWWNSTVAQPNSATSSTIISKGPCIATNLPPTKDNNNTTTEQSSFNTPTPEHLHHRRCSNERDQMWKPPITSADVSMTLDLDETFDLQESQLLVKEPKPYMAVLNQDQQDQMKISGYRRSHLRLILCWICICLTGGLLRLVLHWWRHWYLIATCQPCPLEEAQQVLVEEDYQGKHKLYHVKPVQIITIQHLKNLFYEKVPDETIDDNKLQLSVHFSSAHFKSCRTLRTFRCKQLVYAWDSGTSNFNKINGLDVNVPCSYFHQQRGLALHEQLSRGIVFGVNEITVPLKDVKTLLFLEVLNPFYVFQIFSVILWFTYDYYYYACVIMLMSIFGITMSIIQTKKNQNVLHKTVLNTGHALVVNAKGVPREVLTSSLVPGDIIEIPTSGCTMQCDAVLLSGNCIMDESMLTGESVPVTKTPLPMKRDVIFDKKEHVRHTLFCGTKVIQTRYIGSKKVLAFVINTGNVTAKGGLIRSILYPPPVDYKFEQDSYKFIQCLALIAFVGFIYTLVTKILRGTDATKLIVESLDLITIVVPPALPAAMTVGRFYAQKRLKYNDIYCISPRSINVAGSIDCCCFDKTGTLTEDGMDMWGVVPKSSTNQFQIPLKDIGRLPYDHFLFGMVTCHSITVMNGTMTGDPLDLKMFESTGWILEDFNNIPENEKYGLIYPTILRQPNRVNLGTESKAAPAPVIRQSSVDDLLANVGLSQSEMHFDHGIVREFPFASNLQRMAVITRCLSARGFNVYCKGSPEMIQQLCLPQTLPDDYTQQLSMFAKQGFRIIALGFKALSPKINYTKVQRLSRDDVEHNLEFLGFVIMENRLKADTTAVINSLNLANIRTIMITGDNILTAMSVARDCGIVSSSQAVVTVHAVPSSSPSDKIDSNHQHQHTQYQLQYTLELGSETINMAAPTLNGNKTCLGAGAAFVQHIELSQSNNSLMNSCDSSCTTSVLPNSNSLTSVKTVDTWTHNDDNVDVEIGVTSSQSLNQQHDCWRQNYTFAMDGNTWQIVHDRFPSQMANILTRGAIYARMSPEQKQALIVELQNLDYYVAMCGDGANDCGALKVAHTGISLSETESSIASPFTSRKPTIAAVPMVIKEGRAALVTSFGIFKYMAAYSLVQFISVMILYSINSNLTDKQYLYIDLGLISVFAFFFGKTEAYAGQLVSQVPLSSLISATPLASLLLHLAAVIVFQVAGWLQLHQQTWFRPFEQTADNEHLGCYENYTMFAISSFQYVILAFVFSKGAPYRKPIWSNWPLCLTMAINLAIIIYLVLYPSEWISQFFQLVVPPEISFRLVMLSYGVAAFITHVLIETFIIEYWLFQHCQVQREKNPCTSTRKYMQLQYDMQSFDKWPPITDAFGVHDSTSSDPPTTEMQQPTYVNLSAEQHPDAVQYGIFPGFFENVTTQNAVND